MPKLGAVDLFAGCGGFSTGMMLAAKQLGIDIDLLAINHWDIAIESHTANHPDAVHMCEDLRLIDPFVISRKRRISIMAASPSCTHHSRAKGGQPRSDQSRASGWYVVKWAEASMPKWIIVENVPEFLEWGPVDRKGIPIKRKKGHTFKAFVVALESLGYVVEYQVLNSANYGAATARPRLIIQARLNKRPTWPEETHTPECYRPSSDIIDWSLVGRSIYNRDKALCDNTLRRVYAGLDKFNGLEIVDHQDGLPVFKMRDNCMPRTWTEQDDNQMKPFAVNLRGTRPGQLDNTAISIDRPIPTITAGGGHLMICRPYIIPHHGERPTQQPRTHDIDKPLPVIACSGTMSLLEPIIIGQQSCSSPKSSGVPLPTIAGAGAVQLFEPYMIKYYGTAGAKSLDTPLDTITTKDRFCLLRPRVIMDGETVHLDIMQRMFQPHELKAAMSFPDDYVLTGNKGEQNKQIGNAVEVMMATALWKNALKTLL